MVREISQYFFSSKPVLESMPRHAVNNFKEHLRLKKIKKGRELFREGTYPKAVYIIKRGKVKLFQHSQSGTETIVHIYCEGEMFGYRPLLCNEKYPASAMSIEETAVYVLPVKYFLQALNSSTALPNILLRNLSQEFTVLVNKIGAFAQKSVRERTALSLLILRENYRKAGTRENVEITLSRHDLAAFVGTTIETIARILRRFREEKVIRTTGRKIIIQNDKALFQLID